MSVDDQRTLGRTYYSRLASGTLRMTTHLCGRVRCRRWSYFVRDYDTA
jgi:hypothetical protein